MLSAWRVLKNIGSALFRVRPDRREDQDFAKALLRLVQEIGTTGARVRIIVEGVGRSFRTVILHDLYRIAREGLLNAFRHSQASEIEAELHFAGNHFAMLIRDNGRGMDAERLNGKGGLLRMSEQAQRIGAQFRILSRVAVGTEIQLLLPVGVAFGPRDCDVPSGNSPWPYRFKRRMDSSRRPYSRYGTLGLGTAQTINASKRERF